MYVEGRDYTLLAVQVVGILTVEVNALPIEQQFFSSWWLIETKQPARAFNNSYDLNRPLRVPNLNYTSFKMIDFLFAVRLAVLFLAPRATKILICICRLLNIMEDCDVAWQKKKKKNIVQYPFAKPLTQLCIKDAAKTSIAYFANLRVKYTLLSLCLLRHAKHLFPTLDFSWHSCMCDWIWHLTIVNSRLHTLLLQSNLHITRAYIARWLVDKRNIRHEGKCGGRIRICRTKEKFLLHVSGQGFVNNVRLLVLNDKVEYSHRLSRIERTRFAKFGLQKERNRFWNRRTTMFSYSKVRDYWTSRIALRYFPWSRKYRPRPRHVLLDISKN